jgi:adenosylcobinamide-phosphate synthase
MWGYTVERWRLLGWAAARGDDVLAFVPARLSVLVLWLTDGLYRFLPLRRLWRGNWPGFGPVLRQARGMPSPNSGLSMTACARLCAGRMAGPSIYFGEPVDKPWLGPPKTDDAPDWDNRRLADLCGLLRQAGFMAVGLFFAIHFFKL